MEVISTKKKTKKKRKARSVWVKTMAVTEGNTWSVRNPDEIRREDEIDYTKYFRMAPTEFDEILLIVQDKITKKDRRMREAIPAATKLAATFRFLATGESYRSLQYQYRIHRSTIAKFIPEICDALFLTLSE